MNVCFFRHGLAVEPGTAGVADDERALTEDGRRKTRSAARGLKRLKLGVDTILTSPLPRATAAKPSKIHHSMTILSQRQHRRHSTQR